MLCYGGRSLFWCPPLNKNLYKKFHAGIFFYFYDAIQDTFSFFPPAGLWSKTTITTEPCDLDAGGDKRAQLCKILRRL